ncbi:hypothetical protein GN244_ATG14136 [Phytophthora infestans]|uniref:Uncharacterized protein n=1 Tax=Phytophthora infestans TaxID=4787 RepID=A0A833RUY7_PHYIN|nr:hypothetical protein GN244_ATG14136 [Phytophthora infestans]
MTAVVRHKATIARDQQSGVFHRHEPVAGVTANHRDEVVGANHHGIVAVARHHVVRNVDMATVRGGVSQAPPPRATFVPMDLAYRSGFAVGSSASGSDIPTGELEWILDSGSQVNICVDLLLFVSFLDATNST